ncbi:MAG: hypothetical protein KDC98_24885 [Planctomycetes bacterium]|nr:hypothetical protein [Planctomycetota bacterium]
MSAEDGMAALRALAGRHPELIPEIEQIVRENTSTITHEDIADEVVAVFAELTMFDLDRPNAADPFGYESPTDKAWDVVTETIQPFVEATHRLAKMGLVAAAVTHCQGTLLGLYRSDREQVSELLEWAPDALSELSDEPLKALSAVRRRTMPGKKITVGKALKEFARENLPEWGWLQK